MRDLKVNPQCIYIQLFLIVSTNQFYFNLL